MRCRASEASDLTEVLDLGYQSYTGFFPSSPGQEVPKARLSLSFSPTSNLLQMSQSFDAGLMYGDNYGYQSGLNSSMVSHLRDTVDYLLNMRSLSSSDVFLDIGSNDGTLLNFDSISNARRVGIDPSAEKFAENYRSDITLVTDFFTQDIYQGLGVGKASIVTSISMFYDLENPVAFAKSISNILKEDGIWFLEQSYLPYMLNTNSFDTICHEHYEYYSLTSLKYILDKVGLVIHDVRFNDVNGGSFGVVVSKPSLQPSPKSRALVDWILSYERSLELDAIATYQRFMTRVGIIREGLLNLLESLRSSSVSIAGLGASTKGNVLLQYCGIDSNILPVIGDINPNKFGCFTPGSNIPIIDEKEVLASNPEYLLILPWHFKSGFLRRLDNYRKNGGKVIFPLPFVQIY